MTEDKRVFESGNNLDNDAVLTNEEIKETRGTEEIFTEDQTLVTDENRTYEDGDVPMSEGENCGIVEFEGQRVNTCEGEKIVDSGYTNPDL